MLFFEDCKHRREKRRLERGVSLFLDGKYERAKKLLKDRHHWWKGDVAAVQIFLDYPTNETIEQCRAVYAGLCTAKRFSFSRDEVKQMMESRLEAVTSIVMQDAKSAIDAIYRHYQNGEAEALFRACEEHVAYEHPDAVALQIWGYMDFDLEQSLDRAPRYYSSYSYVDWLFRLENAMEKGVSAEFQEYSQQVLQRLRQLVQVIDAPPPPTFDPWNSLDISYGDY